jgi:hypothetical protein
VIFFLFHRWFNPGIKSISYSDLKDYGVVTALFFAFLLFDKVLVNLLFKQLKELG